MTKNTRYILRVTPLILVDMLVASFCVLLAYILRDETPFTSVSALLESEHFQPYFSLIIFAPFIRAFTYNLFGVYDERRLNVVSASTLVNIAKAVTLGSVILIVVAFMYRGVYEYRHFSYSRLVFAFDWCLSLVIVSGIHATLASVRNELRRHGIGFSRVVVQGAGESARTLIKELKAEPRSGYEVLGFIGNNVPEDAPAMLDKDCRYLGSATDLLEIVNTNRVDEIVITNAQSLGCDLMDFVDDCHKVNVVVKVSLDFYGILTQGRELDDMAGMPVVQVNELAIEGFARVLKRVEDLTIAGFLLLITTPLWAVIAIAIKRESPGPILFKQHRVGRNGRTFVMYKFRSMIADAEQRKKELVAFNEAEGLIFKMKNDPRVTWIGNILRRTNLDEIPQFINVLKGEMSLVGPRPPVPEEVAQYDEKQKRRLGTTPGITGLWQVNRGRRHSFDEVLNWDTYYIENWSLWLDLKILMKTFWVVVTGKSSY